MAWWSEFGTFRRDLGKKHDAGVPIALELREGRLILEKFVATASAADRSLIERHLQLLVRAEDGSTDRRRRRPFDRLPPERFVADADRRAAAHIPSQLALRVVLASRGSDQLVSIEANALE